MLQRNLSEMKIRYILFFVFSSILVNAQVPSYMVKRFTVGYSNCFFIAGLGPTANAVSAIGNIGVNRTLCLNIM